MERHQDLTPWGNLRCIGVTPSRKKKRVGMSIWASCDLYSDVCDEGDLPDDNGNAIERVQTIDRILKDYWNERFSDDEDNMDPPFKTNESKECEDPKEYGEDKANVIFRAILDKLNNDWFKGSHNKEKESEATSTQIDVGIKSLLRIRWSRVHLLPLSFEAQSNAKGSLSF
nr:hypothetical protein [Tanacetum cinerariifolium]